MYFDLKLQNNRGTLITRDGIIFFKNLTYTPVQTINFKIKGRRVSIPFGTSEDKNLQTCCKGCENKNQCCKKQWYNEKYEEEEDEYDIREKYYILIEVGSEFYNFEIGIKKIGTIKSPKDIDNVVQILDEMKIIGEKTLKYWENNKVICS